MVKRGHSEEATLRALRKEVDSGETVIPVRR